MKKIGPCLRTVIDEPSALNMPERIPVDIVCLEDSRIEAIVNKHMTRHIDTTKIDDSTVVSGYILPEEIEDVASFTGVTQVLSTPTPARTYDSIQTAIGNPPRPGRVLPVLAKPFDMEDAIETVKQLNGRVIDVKSFGVLVAHLPETSVTAFSEDESIDKISLNSRVEFYKGEFVDIFAN